MVSLTLKVIFHVAENDSKYRDVAPLIGTVHVVVCQINKKIFDAKLTFHIVTWCAIEDRRGALDA